MRLPTEERFWARVKKTETCWLWTGALDHGYGLFLINKKGRKAHRVSYELVKGSIPDGLTLDHLCKTKNCVNPAHLEPVTLEENQRRHWGPHCPRGHLFTPENTGRNSRGARICRTCRKIQRRNNKIKQKELRARAEERQKKPDIPHVAKQYTRPSKGIPNLRQRRLAVRVAHEMSLLLARISAAEIRIVS